MWRLEKRVQAVWDTVEEYLRRLPEPLPSQWLEDEHTLAGRCSVARVRELTGHREMFPSIPMIGWTAEAVDFTDQETLHQLGEGALLAYLYLRFQDDVMDGHASSPGGLLTGNLCLNRFYAIYQTHFDPGHPFWALWDEVLTLFSATTLWELRRHRKQRRNFTAADLARLGEKFIPVLAWCAAVAYLADDPEVIPELKELTLLLGTGLQLLNDHKGIAHDFKTQNYTSVISDILLGIPEVHELESASFPRRALTSEAMERNLLRSTLFFKRARQTAERLHMAAARAYIDENMDYLGTEIRRVAEMRTAAQDLERMDEAQEGGRL